MLQMSDLRLIANTSDTFFEDHHNIVIQWTEKYISLYPQHASSDMYLILAKRYHEVSYCRDIPAGGVAVGV